VRKNSPLPFSLVRSEKSAQMKTGENGFLPTVGGMTYLFLLPFLAWWGKKKEWESKENAPNK